MKIAVIKIALLFVLVPLVGLQASEKLHLSKKKPETKEEEYLYEIKDGEAFVNDELITLIAVGEETISASYRNKTKEEKKPKYTIRIYNSYGLMVGTKTVGESMVFFGASTYMEPGGVAAEKIYLDEFPLAEILENSNVQIPEDLMEMKWIVISNNNTSKESNKSGDDNSE